MVSAGLSKSKIYKFNRLWPALAPSVRNSVKGSTIYLSRNYTCTPVRHNSLKARLRRHPLLINKEQVAAQLRFQIVLMQLPERSFVCSRRDSQANEGC